MSPSGGVNEVHGVECMRESVRGTGKGKLAGRVGVVRNIKQNKPISIGLHQSSSIQSP